MRRLRYIHQLPDWPDFRWDDAQLAVPLAAARNRQGLLLGRMAALGFPLRQEATLETLTEEVVRSSAIEGETLPSNDVRSSIARGLGLDAGGAGPADRHIEGIVEMMLDATGAYDRPLTEERLFGWHAALFPTGRSGMHRIRTGAWRGDETGEMQVVSGPLGRERVHYEAPPAGRVPDEMRRFLTWFERPSGQDPVLRAGLAHLWFVTIHPFADGNGRIARAVAEMALARSERSAQRYYSMSSQIMAERAAYYDTLERTQKGTMDVTAWMSWFLACLARAIYAADGRLGGVLQKARFWQALAGESMNQRQRRMLNLLLEGFDGKLTTSKWATITKTSTDTALRDITDLVERGVLTRGEGGGRSVNYVLADAPSGLSASG